MEKIAILAFSYAPYNVTGTFRILRLVKYFPQAGFQPIIFTAEQGNHHLNYSLLKEIPKEAKVYRIKSFVKDSQELSKKTNQLYQNRKNLIYKMLAAYIKVTKDLLFSPDIQIIWAISVIPILIRKVLKYKIKYLLVTGGPFSLFLTGVIIKKICNIKLILDFRDPWIEFRDQKKQTFLRQFHNKWMERLCVSEADKIIVVTEKMRIDYNSKYNLETKISVIYNGFDENDYRMFSDIYDRNSCFTFFYSGLMEKESIMYDPTQLINCFVAFYIKYRLDVKLVLCGNFTKEIVQFVNIKDIEGKICLIPFQKRESLLILQQKADCLVHFHYPQKTVFALSIKLFEYAQMKKPIISINTKNAESSIFIEKGNLGLVVENDNINSIISAFFEVYKMNKKKFAEHINYNYINQYNCQNQVQKLSDLIRSIN